MQRYMYNILCTNITRPRTSLKQPTSKIPYHQAKFCIDFQSTDYNIIPCPRGNHYIMYTGYTVLYCTVLYCAMTSTCVHNIIVLCYHCLQATNSLQEEVRSLQAKLNKERDMAIKQGERLSQVRASKRELDLENSELKLSLRKAKVLRCIVLINRRRGSSTKFGLEERMYLIRNFQSRYDPSQLQVLDI